MTSPASARLRAVIFDFDGVIVDTEPLHFATLARTLSEVGLTLSAEAYARTYVVLDDRDSIRTAFAEARRALDAGTLHALTDRKAALFDERMQAGVALFPGAAECVRSLASEFPLAIASGALRREIEAILAHHGLRDAFVGIVSADDVAHGKPHPESYLRACELLNDGQHEPLRPAACVVVEDTVHGVRGAKAAGMRVLAVTNSYGREHLADADAVVDSLEGLTPRTLRRLMANGARTTAKAI